MTKLSRPLHDRRLDPLDRPYGAELAEEIVVDPYEPRHDVVANKSLRDDPLERLHKHGRILDEEYRAGKDFRRHFQAVEIGRLKTNHPVNAKVDGGKMIEAGLTDKQRDAYYAGVKYLTKARHALGQEGYLLACEVLGRRTFLRHAAEKGAERFVAMLFRRCLKTLHRMEAEGPVRRVSEIRAWRG